MMAPSGDETRRIDLEPCGRRDRRGTGEASLEAAFIRQDSLSKRQRNDLWTRIDRTYRPLMEILAAKRGSFSGDDLDDAWQNVLCRLYLNRGLFDPKRGRLGTWIASVVCHEAIRFAARRGKLRRLSSIQQLEERGALPVEATDQTEVADELRAAFAHLAPREREILRAHFIEGWSARELAEVSDRSPRSIEAVMYRAIRRLRRARDGRKRGGREKSEIQ